MRLDADGCYETGFDEAFLQDLRAVCVQRGLENDLGRTPVERVEYLGRDLIGDIDDAYEAIWDNGARPYEMLRVVMNKQMGDFFKPDLEASVDQMFDPDYESKREARVRGEHTFLGNGSIDDFSDEELADLGLPSKDDPEAWEPFIRENLKKTCDFGYEPDPIFGDYRHLSDIDIDTASHRDLMGVQSPLQNVAKTPEEAAYVALTGTYLDGVVRGLNNDAVREHLDVAARSVQADRRQGLVIRSNEFNEITEQLLTSTEKGALEKGAGMVLSHDIGFAERDGAGVYESILIYSDFVNNPEYQERTSLGKARLIEDTFTQEAVSNFHKDLSLGVPKNISEKFQSFKERAAKEVSLAHADYNKTFGKVVGLKPTSQDKSVENDSPEF